MTGCRPVPPTVIPSSCHPVPLEMRDLGRLLIIAGLLLAAVGVILATGNRLNLGRLPGDIVWRRGRMSSTHVLIAAVFASLIADLIWYELGRRYGYRILRTLCRISLSPDSCVRDTEARFERWGLKSLLIAKFIPGFSTVAPPLAGAARQSRAAFLLYDGVGALIWAGAAVAAGRLFFRAIDRVLLALENLGWWAGLLIGSA